MAGAKRMAIGLGAVLMLGAATWVIFGPHAPQPTIDPHKQIISGPDPGEGKDITQPPPGMPNLSKSSGPPAAKPSPETGAGAQ